MWRVPRSCRDQELYSCDTHVTNTLIWTDVSRVIVRADAPRVDLDVHHDDDLAADRGLLCSCATASLDGEPTLRTACGQRVWLPVFNR